MAHIDRGTAAYRAVRRAAIAALAAAQGGILSRRQLYRHGVTRWEARCEIRAGRWARTGGQTVHIGPELPDARWWRAVLEVGPTAAVDGVSALIIAGLRTIDSDTVHVAVPKSSTPRPCRGVTVHETRRYDAADVIREGVPRMKPAVAAVHAALWARSDKEAALFVLAAVQQGLATPAELAEQVERIRRHPRRALLRGLVGDVSSGVESVGERTFARLCAARGFPEPSRQVRRTTPTGRVYLDNRFDPYGLTVEIDGAQHLDVVAATADALKQNVVSLDGDIVLRVPVWALRTDPEPFLDQIEDALRRRGWRASALAASG